ncbi:hypothetical protein [Algoriphagus sp. Y33]|uniref:hypothetical protein n=1 Tax=Algoriphagus sp. Y33 TaxID=2772483 RepID=UPI00177D6372|nr:hypothetical protein [Algoriphagus sp. Y33]
MSLHKKICCFILILASCSPKQQDDTFLADRVNLTKETLNISTDNFLVVLLDECPSCQVIYKDIARKHLDSGSVVIASKNSKKAKLFIGGDFPNLKLDKDFISKRLNLIESFPVFYRKNGNSYDSLVILPPKNPGQ